MKIKVIKKDGTIQPFSFDTIKKAVTKSADRAMETLNDNDWKQLEKIVTKHIKERFKNEIKVIDIHRIVEKSLEDINKPTAKSYRDFRNYKTESVEILNEIYKRDHNIRYIGDNENSNSDSTLVSTKRSLIYGEVNKELYKKFFLNVNELDAIKKGYIYIHDMSARRDSINCCLANVTEIFKGGFEMGNIHYNEPKTLDVAFDVLGDVIFSMSAQQYGGYTVPEIDTFLLPYLEKSYNKYIEEYFDIVDTVTMESPSSEYYQKRAREFAKSKIQRDLEQGFQGLEYKLNTVGSSRGDYPFVTVTFGLETSEFGKMISKACLTTRMKGQGKEGFKRPVLFPKLVFLYDEEIHGEGKISEDLFNLGVECSKLSMYPDWLSLSGEGYVPEIYKKYKKVISPMGCRAFLSPYYERGGIEPADENDQPIFIGRANLGAISLNLPMIYAKSQKDCKDFFEELDHFLEMIRKLHIKTYEYLSEMRASTNPLGFCEGGFYKGYLNPNDKIGPVIKSFTLSFGITALNELEQIAHNESLVSDGSFALKTLEYINDKIVKFKKEDSLLYAIYSTPAESLCGKQVKQFRKEFGIVKNVSDRNYVSNSFHCHVGEDITPIEKQDLEKRFWNLSNGGKIQYCKYPISYNTEAIKILLRRAMKLGFYEGVNLSLSYCNKCGHEQLDMDICPKCGSDDIIEIERMNGYLSFSKINGKSRLNDAKMAEIKDRVSM